VNAKTVLLVDDEQMFLEALEDALSYEGYRVLKARDVSTALQILNQEHVDLVSIDIMISPGAQLEESVNSQEAGVYLCERVTREYPDVNAFCLSVANDSETIRRIKRLGIPFLPKGETPLRTVLNMMRARLTGIAYSTERNPKRSD
jgi:DNA-binding response OmpR family regulator